MEMKNTTRIIAITLRSGRERAMILDFSLNFEGAMMIKFSASHPLPQLLSKMFSDALDEKWSYAKRYYFGIDDDQFMFRPLE